MNVAVTLGDRSGSVAVAAKPAPEPVKKDPDVLDGVQVADITAQQRQALRIDENVRGALVTTVPAGTPSADAELRPGDVIISINGKDVKDAEDAVKLSEDAKHLNSVRLRVHRAGQTRFVIVEGPKEN
jgi:serine protease Do